MYAFDVKAQAMQTQTSLESHSAATSSAWNVDHYVDSNDL